VSQKGVGIPVSEDPWDETETVSRDWGRPGRASSAEGLGVGLGGQAETLRLYRLIATMDAAAPLPSLADQVPTWASASNLARNWGLDQVGRPLG
jgi:hypothetical protein